MPHEPQVHPAGDLPSDPSKAGAHSAFDMLPYPSKQIRYLACTAPQSRQRLRAQRASANQPKHSSGKDLPSDRSIPYTSIMIVVEGQGITGPHRTEDVLNGLNLATHTLRLVSAKPQGPRDQVLAVCKVFNRAEEAERKANEEAVRLEKEKLNAKQKYKIVEIGWAIADNDLALKAKRLKEFLESGYKVEVVLKGKRHGRKATSEEAEDVLRRVREAWAEVPGAREARTPDGEVGKMMRTRPAICHECDPKRQPANREKPAAASQPASATAAGEKKLSGAELKAKAKAEKAARRAASKVVAPPTPAAGTGGDAKGARARESSRMRLKPSWERHSASPLSPGPKREQTLCHTIGIEKVIDSYTTPAGNTLSRHFTSHVLNPQIEYLTECRPMCFSMGNAIRWLKLQISKIDVDSSDDEAKKHLCEDIDCFIREKVIIAAGVIVENAAEEIEDQDVIVTYANHHLIRKALLKAHKYGKNFRVVVINDPHDGSGAEMAKALQEGGLNVTYCPDLSGSLSVVRHSTKTLVAAEAVFSNGSIYARAGTCDVALAAADSDSEMIVLCESINFTERMATDSLTYNEIDPEFGVETGFRLLYDTTTPRMEFL
ncbi:unnamed protein product [Parascedosporium putredinis]|uniref:Translation initiation factor eIF2B subunit delta n=1 Tax=Parascedosporium putredinis TaxID=1442378 RepID=A0A9P1MAU0_9PEZI|nr:unnamed protein product [Parascedosporium putredinis]CAI7994965.1 unnamed protein product [Parascedosporium putredinis]